MYIIKKGTVECVKENKVVRTLNKGDYFGELAIIQKIPRSLTVKAGNAEKVSDMTTVMVIKAEMLTSILGDKLQNVMNRNILKMAMTDHSEHIKAFGLNLIESFIDDVEILIAEPEQVIFSKGTPAGNCLFVLLEGAVVFKDSQQTACEKHRIMNENAIFSKEKTNLDEHIIASPKEGAT